MMRRRLQWHFVPVLGTLVALAALVVGLVPVGAGASAPAIPHFSLGETATFSVPGVPVTGTPTKYDQVMVRRFGNPSAGNVLVLVPGTLAGAADFDIVGPYLASHIPNLQVWAEMRREGALQNDSAVLERALQGKATVTAVFKYYLDWIATHKITNHYQPLKTATYAFVDQWGLATAMGDLHNVVEKARDGGHRHVILGGHSLGGAEAAIYPAWDFNGDPGYKDIDGIIGIDGDDPMGTRVSLTGSTPLVTATQAQAALTKLESGSPFLTLLGFHLPWITGAFAQVAAIAALEKPNMASLGESFPLLPAELKPPVASTNLAQLGYAFDATTSPAALSLIHVHAGHLAASGSPRGWVNDGPTPAQDVAWVFSQEPLGPVDWYYPARLTLDVEAASSLTETPAAQVLGLRLEHLSQVDVPLYVIQTSLGGTDNAVMNAANLYKSESRIPNVTIVNRASTYGHLDPLLAAPSDNTFLKTVVPWIEHLPGYRR